MAGAESSSADFTACAFYQFYDEGGGTDRRPVCGFLDADGTPCGGTVEQQVVPPTNMAEVTAVMPVLTDTTGQRIKTSDCAAMPSDVEPDIYTGRVSRRAQATFWAAIVRAAQAIDAASTPCALPKLDEAYKIGGGCAVMQAGYHKFSKWLEGREVDANLQFTCAKLNLSTGQLACSARAGFVPSENSPGKYSVSEPLGKDGQPDPQATCAMDKEFREADAEGILRRTFDTSDNGEKHGEQ